MGPKIGRFSMKKLLLIALLGLTLPLLAEVKALVIVGSTREDSVNKKLAQEAVLILEEMGGQVTVANLKSLALPFYDGDVEAKEGLPKEAKRLQALMLESDAIVIVSPEYNASIPAVLKNALDWVSRHENYPVFKQKKFAIMSASPSRMGGSRGLVHLRAVLEDMGGSVVASQVCVPKAYQAFNSEGRLESSELRAELEAELKQLF
jgi:NAD(P)H-dependent FMN reductase